MMLSQREREQILQRVVSRVARNHFNPTVDQLAWGDFVRERKHRVLSAGSVEEFEGEIQELLSFLKTSHTGFFHRTSRRVPSHRSIAATLRRGQTRDGVRWFFEDVHREGPAQQAGICRGDVLLYVDGEEIIPPAVPLFRMDSQFLLMVERAGGSRIETSVVTPPVKDHRFLAAEPAVLAFDVLDKNVGFIKITHFPGMVGIDLARQLDSVFQKLASCDRLIIDLRGNSGGGIGGLRLMSYLTPGRLPVGYSLTRRRAIRGYEKERLPRFGGIPTTKALLPWLLVRYALVDKSIVVVTEGLGPQTFHGRIVILVNEHTASAGEMVAAFAKENGLATLVGTTTAGRLLSSKPFKVGSEFVLVLPVASYLTWNGDVIEGKGVDPHVPVELFYDRLQEGADTQLQMALKIASAM